MKTNKLIITGLLTGLITVSGCSDWQTTPVTVDEHHGMAVKNMVKNQILYPEHSQEYNPVTSINGNKGEGIMKSYLKPATDLRKGKDKVKFEISNER